MKYRIDIDIYRKPNICIHDSHKIDFMNENDIYNPFSNANHYAHISSSIDDAIYDKIVDLVVFYDLSIDDLQKSFDKSKAVSDSLFVFLKDEMAKNNIHFEKSSKYFMQSSFVRVKFNANDNNVLLFFQILGTTHKKNVVMTSMHFIKCIV